MMSFHHYHPRNEAGYDSRSNLWSLGLSQDELFGDYVALKANNNDAIMAHALAFIDNCLMIWPPVSSVTDGKEAYEQYQNDDSRESINSISVDLAGHLSPWFLPIMPTGGVCAMPMNASLTTTMWRMKVYNQDIWHFLGSDVIRCLTFRNGRLFIWWHAYGDRRSEWPNSLNSSISLWQNGWNRWLVVVTTDLSQLTSLLSNTDFKKKPGIWYLMTAQLAYRIPLATLTFGTSGQPNSTIKMPQRRSTVPIMWQQKLSPATLSPLPLTWRWNTLNLQLLNQREWSCFMRLIREI